MKYRLAPSIADSIILLVNIFCALLLLTCSDGNNDASSVSDDTGGLSFNVAKNSGDDISRAEAAINCEGDNIATVEALVFDLGDVLLSKGGPWDCTDGGGTILSVPAGSGRTIVILGKMSDGSIVLHGEKSGIRVEPDVENIVGTIACNGFTADLRFPADRSVVNNQTMGLGWTPLTGKAQYQVLVSKNNDLTDPVINADVTVENFVPLGLSNAQTYFWGVAAFDQYGHLGMTSQIWSFTVDEHHNNTAPVVQITSPATESEFSTDESITFVGICNDGEEGDLSDASLVWRSSQDGVVGSGKTFGSDTLTAGIHQITLTATDADGATGEASIQIIVKSLEPGQCLGNEDPDTECTACLPGWTNANGDHCNTLLRYVDINNSGREGLDGITWATARFTVQDGIDTCQTALQANPGANHCEVWVAEGTYYIYFTANHNAVQLKTGVHVYGGFSGTETNRDQRNWAENVTVLDGHRLADSEERVEHVVLSETDGVIDGFTISGAYSQCDDVFEGGAGMYIGANSKAVVRNTIFRDNKVDCHTGAGMYVAENSAVTLINCTYANNYAEAGGGLSVKSGATLKAENCLFESNIDFHNSAAAHISGADTVFVNSQFINHNRDWGSSGGAIHAIEHERSEVGEDGKIIRTMFKPSLVVDGCLFKDNDGDMAIKVDQAQATIRNCGFVNNQYNAVVHSTGTEGTLDISSSYFIGNTARTTGRLSLFAGGAISYEDNQQVTVTNCTIVDNTVEAEHADTVLGGGIYGKNAPVTITNCIIRGNIPEQVNASTPDATITYSNVAGLFPLNVQDHNIDLPVYFAGGADLHLLAHDPQDPQKRNPCIDTGNGDAAPATDFDGNQRVDDPLTPNTGSGTPGYVDMGAFEYQP